MPDVTTDILARISALEVLLTHMFVLHYEQLNASDEWIAEQHAKMKRLTATNATSTSPDPANGDHFSEVTTEILGELLDYVERVRTLRKKRK
jgi:hypothetical protein